MPLKFRVWSVGRILVVMCALAGTFLLFFGVALRVALRAREVQVPALKAGETHPIEAKAQGTGIAAWRYKSLPAKS